MSRAPLPKARRRQRPSWGKGWRKAIVSDVESDDSVEGRLFGRMDPHRVMSLDSNDYITESNNRVPISLSLLEWKRRQQWDPNASNSKASSHETYMEGVRTLPPKLIAAGITATLPTWDSVNPIPDMQRQPATTEPMRRRHSDAKYAEWITRMINCLNR